MDPARIDAATHNWARIALLRMLVRLQAMLRAGQVLPDDPPKGGK